MPRNRIIYQSLALYAGQNSAQTGTHTGVNDIKQLTRVQSWDSDFSRNFTDINQYGQLAARDRIEVEAPTVNMSTSWYPTDGSNERYIGLSVCGISGSQSSLLSGIMKKETDERNYFLTVVSEGSDAVGFSGQKTGAFGVGNAFLTSYSLEASVGDVPTASADFEALNFAVYESASGHIPSINPTSGTKITGISFSLPLAKANDQESQPIVLRPGDITLGIKPTGVGGPDYVKGFDADDIKIQSFTLSTDLSRTPIEKLGSRFPFSREIDFPVTATLSIEAQMGDLKEFNLSNLLCETDSYDLSVRIRRNDCNNLGDDAIFASLKGAKLLSENFSTSIGDNASVTLEYEASIGGPEDSAKGVFISGSYRMAPILKSSTFVTAKSGQAFNYDIVTESYPPIVLVNAGYQSIRFGGLPAGLTYTSGTSVISGTPTTTGVFSSLFTGVNSFGMTGVERLTFSVTL